MQDLPNLPSLYGLGHGERRIVKQNLTVAKPLWRELIILCLVNRAILQARINQAARVENIARDANCAIVVRKFQPKSRNRMIVFTNIYSAAMKVFELGAIVKVMKINVCTNIPKKGLKMLLSCS